VPTAAITATAVAAAAAAAAVDDQLVNCQPTASPFMSASLYWGASSLPLKMLSARAMPSRHSMSYLPAHNIQQQNTT
jgi:hypothetical protein